MTTEATNSPAFMLYRVDGNGPEARWTRIGAAWPNKDGKGFNILCDAAGVDGRRDDVVRSAIAMVFFAR